MITGRLRLLDNSDSISKISLGDGGMLQDELDSALAVVHRASFISRSIQKNLIGHLSKDDNSPVTIADFAVQALVVYYLNKAFPNDKFIAEENSELVREDKDVRDDILRTLRGASDIDWDEELLFNTIDKGGFDGSAERVWVLDPVDGTKGFMRGEHYCIALALLINGIPSLSVMGCPNLHLENVLEPKIGAKEVNGLTGSKNEVSVSFVEESVTYPAIATAIENKRGVIQDRKVFSPRGGSIFFAVTGRGAYARPLAMPLGGAYEVQVSDCKEASNSVLCESAEATHGDRSTTLRVFSSLQLKNDFVRLDGQCKYCVVGSGAAEGNMRLPPLGYIEKVWDHAPGAHFIIEAGGEMTDLSGERIDFSKGRSLDASVTGILASNKVMHSTLLAAILSAREIEEDEILSGKTNIRASKMN
eukprot:CAMPEP_0119039860 /NCGR_PEP_ID=MMETSP1177-20130426/9589_1 /TAXON_ID=2985 /ORGANISM="Ochromonas sp, Strain CCMP1899" /LENGTH=417 /DNA_ID=CAMNT_0007004291 /DNA_START=391 /DNA_END=1644 /DNA_ORIENTATION=-